MRGVVLGGAVALVLGSVGVVAWLMTAGTSPALTSDSVDAAGSDAAAEPAHLVLERRRTTRRELISLWERDDLTPEERARVAVRLYLQRGFPHWVRTAVDEAVEDHPTVCAEELVAGLATPYRGEAAADRLGQMGASAVAVLPQLEQSFAEHRDLAADALVAMGDAATGSIVRVLGGDDEKSAQALVIRLREPPESPEWFQRARPESVDRVLAAVEALLTHESDWLRMEALDTALRALPAGERRTRVLRLGSRDSYDFTRYWVFRGVRPEDAPSLVDVLERALQDPKPGVASAAAEALLQLEEAWPIDALIEWARRDDLNGDWSAELYLRLARVAPEATRHLTRDSDSRVREAALVALTGHLDDPANVACVLEGLRAPGTDVRSVLGNGFTSTPPAATEIWDALRRYATEASDPIRQAAVRTLALQKELPETSLQALGEVLSDPAAPVRFQLVEALDSHEDWDDARLSLLARLLDDENSPVRARAQDVVRSHDLDTGDIRSVLVRWCQVDEIDDSLDAAETLGDVVPGSSEVLSVFARHLENDDRDVRWRVVWRLHRFTRVRDAYRQGAVDLLRKRIVDRFRVVREAAVGALWRLEPESAAAVPELMRLLEKAAPEERKSVLEALTWIGPDARDAADLIRRDLDADDPELREAAERTLRSMERDRE